MNRFTALIKREWMTDKKDYLTYGLVIVLVLFGLETLQTIAARYTGTDYPEAIYNGMFSGFLLIGGFIMTSLMFAKDLFSKDTQHGYLMLPATNFEKFLSKALLSTVVYPLVLMVLFFVTSLITEPILLLFFRSPIELFNPFADRDFGLLLANFWVWNSIFFLGATYFHKAHFIKTVLAVGVISIGLGILALIFARVVFAIKFGPSLEMLDTFVYFESSALDSFRGAMKAYVVIGTFLYYFALPIFCLVTAYFKVEEVQATDAV